MECDCGVNAAVILHSLLVRLNYVSVNGKRFFTVSLCVSQGSSGRTRSVSLLPHLPPSSSPVSQRHLPHHGPPSNVVTITRHKSPAAARRAKNQYPERLLEVKEVRHTSNIGLTFIDYHAPH